MPKTVYRSSCRDKHNCPRRDSNLDPLTLQSDSLTTRLLRTVYVYIKETVYSPQCSIVIQMSCKLHHPFTAIVAGPMGSSKSEWVLRLINQAKEIIEPPPSRIWYCYGEFQPTFNNYPQIHFHEGLPDLSDTVFDS